jgi:hypothetical protein
MKGIPTKRRYCIVTVIVDHYSRFTYTNLKESTSSIDTLKAKESFEAMARSLGITIKHYHADNGRFADTEFIKSIESNGQTISYSGVNAHFQNGISERRIRDLQEGSRAMLMQMAQSMQCQPLAVHF